MSKIIHQPHTSNLLTRNAAEHDARGAALRAFKTHTGEFVTGERLQAALDAVAADWAHNAHAIRLEDAYASHVTEDRKDADLAQGLALAETIRRGEATSFTIWQRVNTALTGECIALLA